MDVGVRELKARLSSYVKRARAGETITITEHGRPVAVLAPIMGRADLDAAASEGWVVLGSRRALRPVPRQTSSRSVASALDDDRGR